VANQDFSSAYERFQSRSGETRGDSAAQSGAYSSDLTRVPGVIGQMADWLEASARKPSRPFALGAALAVGGTILGHTVLGVEEVATHLNVALLGPTTRGKGHIISASKNLLRSAGADCRIGPGDFGSSTAFVETLVAKEGVFLSLMDEFGDILHRMAKPTSGGWESDLLRAIKEIFSLSFEAYYPARKAKQPDYQPIFAPAPSVVGFSTLQRFYDALRGKDIGGGFLNRFLIIEDRQIVESNRSRAHHAHVPPALEQALKALYTPRQKPQTAEEILTAPIDGSFEPAVKMSWGLGAQAAFFDFEKSMTFEEDELKQAVFGRAAEKACKIASIVVFFDGRTVVEVADFNWAKDWVLKSDQTLFDGVKKYGVDPQDFVGTCRQILNHLRQAPKRQMSMRNLKRKCATLIHRGKDMDGALQYLAECGCLVIIGADPAETPRRGRPASVMIKWLAELTDEDDEDSK
jgi:hypothetical protein